MSRSGEVLDAVIGARDLLSGLTMVIAPAGVPLQAAKIGEARRSGGWMPAATTAPSKRP